MKRWISLVLAAILLLTMTACGVSDTQKPSDEEQTGQLVQTLSGSWKAEIDYAAVVNAVVAQEPVLTVTGATLETCPVTVTYGFAEDGTVTCTVDQKQLYDGLEPLFQAILEPIIAALGNGMTLENYLESTKMTRDELLVSLFTEEILDSMVHAVGFSGEYESEGDRLTVRWNDASATTKIKRDGTSLILCSPIGTTAADETLQKTVAALFPLTLTKVE